MTLRATVPTRLVVDACRLGDDDVGDALDSALGAAVSTAVRTTLEGRPAGTPVAVHEPSLTWMGSGLHGLPDARRDALDRQVRRAVIDALARAGVVDGVLARAPESHREALGERRDPQRHVVWADRYVVPSYGGKKKQAVKVKAKVTGGIMTINGELAPTNWRFATIEEAGDVPNRLHHFLGELHRRHVEATGPRVGTMLLGETGGDSYLVVVYDVAAGEEVTFFGFKGLTNVRAKANGDLEPYPAELNPQDAFHLKVLAGAEPKTEFRKQHLAAVVAEARTHSPPAGLIEPELTNLLTERATKELDKLFDTTYGKVKIAKVVELRTHDERWLLFFDAESAKKVPDDLDIDVYPLRLPKTDDVIHLPKAGAGKGAGAKHGTGDRHGDPGAGHGGGADGADGGAGGQDGKPGGTGPGGGFVVGTPEEGQGQASAFLGTLPTGGKSDGDPCAAWGGEPPIVKLAGYTEALTALMGDIARRLEMPVCPNAGAFLIRAAHVYAARAEQVGLAPVEAGGKTRPVGASGAKTANFGWVEFTSLPSPQVQLLRHLADTTSIIDRMHQVLLDAIKANGHLIEGYWHDRPVSWQLHFLEDFTPAFTRAVSKLFLVSCRVLFLQLLLASRDAIESDRADLTNVAANFEARILPLLEDVQSYIDLRDKLRDHKMREMQAEAARYGAMTYAPPPGPVKHLGEEPRTWKAATEALTRSLGAKTPAPDAGTDAGATGDIGEFKGTYYIRDAKGRWHTTEQLDDLITMTRGSVESIDPLVKHIIELEDVLPRMRDPKIGVKVVLGQILDEMAQHNLEIRTKGEDPMFAFRSSGISEDIPHATVPYSSWALRGIHLQVHQVIGPYFHGDRFYALGIDELFGTEAGYQSLKAFGELVGVVLLSCIYAPLGIAVGIALAAHHYDEAVEKEHIYDALMDPELVITRAEVEMQLFAAKLGLVLALLPAVGKGLSAARPLLTAAATEGEELAAVGGRAAAAEAADAAAIAALKAASHDLLEQFVTELASAIVINKVMELALEPIMASLSKSLETSTSVGGLERALTIVLAHQEQRAKDAKDAKSGAH